jgi:hypothetical protein
LQLSTHIRHVTITVSLHCCVIWMQYEWMILTIDRQVFGKWRQVRTPLCLLSFSTFLHLGTKVDSSQCWTSGSGMCPNGDCLGDRVSGNERLTKHNKFQIFSPLLAFYWMITSMPVLDCASFSVACAVNKPVVRRFCQSTKFQHNYFHILFALYRSNIFLE